MVDGRGRDLVSLVIAFIVMVITLLSFFSTSADEISVQTYTIFGIIVGVLLIGFFVSYVIDRWREINRGMELNKRNISEIKRSLKYERLFNIMERRLSILERLFEEIIYKKSKKGQAIDPRIIFWILLIILLLIFLRSIGVF